MLRKRHECLAAAAAVLAVVAMPALASAYSVAVRWTGEDRAVAGYRLYVRPAGGVERPPIDVPSPRRNGAGHFEARIGDLDVAVSYTFAMSAYRHDGSESERSNSYTIGYAQAARVVDSDRDGLTDAEEDRNLNLRVDGGETDRLAADTDGDDVPDGVEYDFGADPLDGHSPSCGPVSFSDFRLVGAGTANVDWEPALDDLALTTTPNVPRSTAIGVVYPQYGKGTLDDPLLVTRLLDHDPFRIEVRARSTAGRLYRMRYEGHGRVDRITRRRLRRSLGSHFTGERWELIGIDVASDMARMDPKAVFSHIERLTVRGSLVMQQPKACH
jgi:hypothetical protein